jgi:hypothetical protein
MRLRLRPDEETIEARVSPTVYVQYSTNANELSTEINTTTVLETTGSTFYVSKREQSTGTTCYTTSNTLSRLYGIYIRVLVTRDIGLLRCQFLTLGELRHRKSDTEPGLIPSVD